ncbi:MAG TPA: carbonic anhydrase, partial [Sedimenticola sp.]|nr:carbonic anhydrase [Sedimenticola sp.]
TNVCNTTIVKDAWRRGAELSVHGWIYNIQDGIIRELQPAVPALDEGGQPG